MSAARSSVLSPQSSSLPRVMGILNVTPDSFSDGGIHFDHTKALHAALQMIEDGADMIDVGGESTRPGAPAVSVDEEIERVLQIIIDIRRSRNNTIAIVTRQLK